MEKKLRLRLMLRIARAIIDVIELELEREIEHIERTRNENWMEDTRTDSYHNY